MITISQQLLFFILGMLFIEFIPVIESFFTLLNQGLETVKCRWCLSLAKYQKDIQDIQETVKKSSVSAIGFQYSENNNEEQDDEEYEDDE